MPYSSDTEQPLSRRQRLNALKRWKEEGAWIRDGDFVTFPAAFVDDAYQWMRSAEESSEYTYPNTFRELLEALPPLTNPWY